MSGQNRSTAVMQRRKVAPHALDHYPTPPFATRALTEFLEVVIGPLDRMSCWEPACAEGHMVRPLLEAFGAVRASDVHQYRPFLGGSDHELIDFALAGWGEAKVDAIISNPPFKLAAEFIETALRSARKISAMLVRSAFLEGEGRHKTLWARNPPSFILQFSERVVMLEGRLVRRGSADPFSEPQGRLASTATAYCWLVWLRHSEFLPWATGETLFRWIPPSMVRLERPGDYPVYDLTERAECPLLDATSSSLAA